MGRRHIWAECSADKRERMKIMNGTHIWDLKIDDPNQFKIGHDKIIKKFKKEFEGRWVGFGTYDINYPNGATHWVGVSGER